MDTKRDLCKLKTEELSEGVQRTSLIESIANPSYEVHLTPTSESNRLLTAHMPRH